MKVKPELNLFGCKPQCFLYVSDAVLMLISRDLNKKSVSFLLKQGHLRPNFHLKARQLSTQLWNGLLYKSAWTKRLQLRFVDKQKIRLR